MRIYIPYTFINDAIECDPDLEFLWEKIVSFPTIRRGRGIGVIAKLTKDEALRIRKEAEYRAEYWLTDNYGVGSVSPHERTAGLAAQRTVKAIDRAIEEES